MFKSSCWPFKISIVQQAAVDATTRNLALEWGTDYDIRVNGIAPGPISDTPGMSKLAPDEISSKARDYMPLYKLGEKWDIAMTALFLVSDAGWSLYLFTQIFYIIVVILFTCFYYGNKILFLYIRMNECPCQLNVLNFAFLLTFEQLPKPKKIIRKLQK